MQTLTRPSQRLTLMVRDLPGGGGGDGTTELLITGPEVAEAGSGITLSVTNVPDEADNIRWEFGDANSQTTGPGENVQHVYTAPGEYTVTVQARRGSSTLDSAQQVVDVSPAPVESQDPQSFFTPRRVAAGGAALALAVALTR